MYHEPAEVKEIVRLLYQYTKLQRMYRYASVKH